MFVSKHAQPTIVVRIVCRPSSIITRNGRFAQEFQSNYPSCIAQEFQSGLSVLPSIAGDLILASRVSVYLSVWLGIATCLRSKVSVYLFVLRCSRVSVCLSVLHEALDNVVVGGRSLSGQIQENTFSLHRTERIAKSRADPSMQILHKRRS